IWERPEPQELSHSPESQSLFTEYLLTLDQRFAKKKFESRESMTQESGASRVYHHASRFLMWRNETFYFVRLFHESVRARALLHYVRRGIRIAERSLERPRGFGNLIHLYFGVAMNAPSDVATDVARNFQLNVNFELVHILIIDLEARRITGPTRFF